MWVLYEYLKVWQRTVYNTHGQRVLAKKVHQPEDEFVCSVHLAYLRPEIYYIKVSAGKWDEFVKTVKISDWLLYNCNGNGIE